MNNSTKKKLVISDKVWLLISLVTALALWYVLSIGEKTGRSFPFIPKVIGAVGTMIERGAFWKDPRDNNLYVDRYVLGWPKCLFGFSIRYYRKTQIIYQPNICILAQLKKK